MERTMKRCTNCGENKELSEFGLSKKSKDGLSYYCRACVSKNKKQYRSLPEVKERDRETKKKWLLRPESKILRRNSDKIRSMRFPEKIKARKLLQSAVRSGKIKRLPCVMCGNPKSHGHHHDYDIPLDVTWLCQTCHVMVEKTGKLFERKGE
jgi:hypothetical protein